MTLRRPLAKVTMLTASVSKSSTKSVWPRPSTTLRPVIRPITKTAGTVSIWGRDISAIHRLVHKVRAGTVWVNQHPLLSPDVPFGGLKQSGLGVESSRYGLLAYTERLVRAELRKMPAGTFEAEDFMDSDGITDTYRYAVVTAVLRGVRHPCNQYR